MSVAELYSILVVQLGVAPDYVLDRMEVYEMRALIGNAHLRWRESWEQARMIAFITAKCAGAKINDVKDLFRFPWDNEQGATGAGIPTDEELARLKATAQYFIDNGMV